MNYRRPLNSFQNYGEYVVFPMNTTTIDGSFECIQHLQPNAKRSLEDTRYDYLSRANHSSNYHEEGWKLKGRMTINSRYIRVKSDLSEGSNMKNRAILGSLQ